MQVKKVPNKNQKRYLISCVNTPLGHSICNQLRRQFSSHMEDLHILGIKASESNLPTPDGVFRLLDTEKITLFQQAIKDANYLIFDLLYSNFSHIELAIKTLKMGGFKENKTLIIVSSVMVWSNTRPKELKEGEDQEEGVEDFEIDEEQEKEMEETRAQELAEREKAYKDKQMAEHEGDDDFVPEELPAEDENRPKYIKFTEKDYTIRKSSLQFEHFKSIETLALAINHKQVKSYVLCGGILYGNGEDIFYELFKQAWLQVPKELIIYHNGYNNIPSIHVEDLATFVNKVIEKEPKDQYIFAIDHSKKTTQKQIIQSISSGLGTGQIKCIDRKEQEVDQYKDQKYYPQLTLNLKIRPTTVFNEYLEANELIEEDDNGVKHGVFEFNWHCKDGIIENILLLRKEFNTFNSLKANRILIQGPPGVGKTFYSNILKDQYNIPRIDIKSLVYQVSLFENELGEEVKKCLEESKEKILGEMEEEFNKIKEDDQEFVPNMDKVVPIIPDEQVALCFRWRLNQNDCINRGYILDGYPKTYSQSKTIFTIKKEDDDADEPVVEIDQAIIPQNIIIFHADKQYIVNQLQNLEESIIQNSHWDEANMNRRFKIYISNNMENDYILKDFFEEQNISILDIDLKTSKSHINTLHSFIQRNGKFKNFKDTSEQEEINRQKKIQEIILKEKEKQIEQQKVQNLKEEEKRLLQEEEGNIKKKLLKNQDRKILDQKSQPLSQYLADNVVHFLSQGLIEITTNISDDPVDALAQFLFKKSLDVVCPDPGEYNKQYNM